MAELVHASTAIQAIVIASVIRIGRDIEQVSRQPRTIPSAAVAI
jgi:hypothetical protein